MDLEKKDIRLLSLSELKDFLRENSEKPFRAMQIDHWIWQEDIEDFSQIKNIPKDLKKKLESFFYLNQAKVFQSQKSADGTLKNNIKLADHKFVEAVLIPTKNRSTACVSSQVGCSLDCKFCATAKLARMRNLTNGEIYDQVKILHEQSQNLFQRPLSNIVFMGMGEPLLNYSNVVNSIRRIIHSKNWNLAAKRITVSTSGIPKMIRKLADENLKCKLALSLHSAREKIRQGLMPFSRKISFEELLNSLEYWYKKTSSKITFEYLIWKNINDKEEDIKALVKLCQRIPSKVNLIEYNWVGEKEFQGANEKITSQYIKALEDKNIVVKLRKSRGKDIDAACGQLAGKTLSLN